MIDPDDLAAAGDMERKRKREEPEMTNDPVLHALVDLCEAAAEHVRGDGALTNAYNSALQVIREHTGLSAVPEGMAWINRGSYKTWDGPKEQYVYLRGGLWQKVGVYASDDNGDYWTFDVPALPAQD